MDWLGHGPSCFWPFKTDPDCKECAEWNEITTKAEMAAEEKYRAERAARRRTTKRMPPA